MMVPNTQQRLETAHKDLSDMLVCALLPPLYPFLASLVSQQAEQDLSATEEFKAAQAMLDSVKIDG